MSEEPRVIRLKLADGDGRVFTAFQIPGATKVDSTFNPLGYGDRAVAGIGKGLSVLLVSTDDLIASAGPVRPDEETTT